MKKFLSFPSLVVFAMFFIIGGKGLYAQTYIDVPGAQNTNTLYDSVMAHQGEDVIYRLQGGPNGLYSLDKTVIDTTGVPLKIIGDGVEPAPRIVPMNNGSSFNSIAPIGDLYLENIILVGRSFQHYTQEKGVIKTIGERVTFRLKNVRIEWGNIIRAQGKNVDLLAEDCMFINNPGPGESMAWYNRAAMDSGKTVFRNCTFAISGRGLYSKSGASAPHNLTVEHCTFYLIKTPYGGGPFVKNVVWKNNLFIDCNFTGYDRSQPVYDNYTEERFPLEYFVIDTIGEDLMPDRSFSINNNVFWLSQGFKDKLAALNRTEYVVINPRSQTVLAALDSGFYENNIEFTIDPQLEQPIPSDDTMWDTLMTYIENMYEVEEPFHDWRWYNDDTPDKDWDYKVWPYAWSLKPTNEELWDKGDDGYPVGDLNWFPSEIKQAWLAGQDNPLAIEDDGSNIIKSFSLEQNYPNPFNPTTTIKFSTPISEKVKLSVYNVLGQEVKVLVNKRYNSGNHTVEFKAADLASGVYIYRLKAGDFTSYKKMILMK